MTEPSASVGFLHAGELSSEQVAANEWGQNAGFDVESVSLSAVVEGSESLTEYDVVWWHTDDLPDFTATGDLGGILRAFVRNGGGLLLSLAAMAAVDDLGIDPVAPDLVGADPESGESGVLVKSLYDDHPFFAGLDHRRPLTRAGTAATLARYDAILPERGEVLASTVRADHDVPSLVTCVSWAIGDGAIVGLGDGLVFESEATDTNARDALADALLSNVGDVDVPSRPHDTSGIAGLRAQLADDQHRPRYHLSPPANWLNDPNGVTQWNDRFHVFYQYNPGGPYHDTIHWGHAVSDDMVHWEDEPVALTPSPDGPDRDGCWSGCTVDDDGTPTIIYTGGRDRDQLPCLATTDDPDLRHWEKDPGNPVIEEVPADPEILSTEDWEGEFRDHCVWQEDDVWYQLIGAGMEAGGGTALLYESDDLREWRYRGPILTEGEGATEGTVWECPELLDLGSKQLLHVSNYEDVVYFLGEYEDGEFETESQGLLDHGDFYAPQSLRTDEGRLVTWGWLKEARDVSAQWDAGWSGAMSLPREITLDEDEGLRQRPARELTALRVEHERREAMELASGDIAWLDTSGRALELSTRLELVDADFVELSVLASSDGEERTSIRYTRGNELVLDRSAASTGSRSMRDSQRMDVTPYDEPLDLRVFVDGSIVELFANERHCLSGRVYPTSESATGVSLSADGGQVRVPELDAWTLDSAWR